VDLNTPNFERAEYHEPVVIEGNPIEPVGMNGAFAKAFVLGLGAAALGSVGYGVVALSGFMVSIVAIGIGWFVARAMMTGSGGIGGRPYQIAAALLTYFAVSCGQVLHFWWVMRSRLAALDGTFGNHPLWLAEIFIRDALIGPFLAVGRSPFNGAIGLLILFFGLQAAWRIAAGGPGFGRGNRGQQMTPFGMR
jgi:hypothetical protein